MDPGVSVMLVAGVSLLLVGVGSILVAWVVSHWWP
jgi:Flp pilus assembly pilin Flp